MLLQIEKQRILNILKELPQEKLDEVIDFAEYLKKREKILQKPKRKTRHIKIMVFHLGHVEKEACDRNTIYGEHLDRKFD